MEILNYHTIFVPLCHYIVKKLGLQHSFDIYHIYSLNPRTVCADGYFFEGNGLAEVEEGDSDTLACDDDAHKADVCT